MHRFAILCSASLAIALISWQFYGLAPAQTEPQRLKPFMQQKLDHSKDILEALTLENFEQLAKKSQELSLLSLESNWNVLTTDEYIQQSVEFRRACRAIQVAAEERNLDGAALGFVNLTVRCVECHKYLRKTVTATPRKP